MKSCVKTIHHFNRSYKIQMGVKVISCRRQTDSQTVENPKQICFFDAFHQCICLEIILEQWHVLRADSTRGVRYRIEI